MFKSLILKYIDYTEKLWFWMKQKLLFFRELAYLLWWWVGVNDAIKIIAKDWDTAAQRFVWKTIATYLNEGKTLTNSLSRLGHYFEPSDIAIIKAGETSGNLVRVLRNLAQEYAFINTLRNKFIAAITYPVVLLVIALIAILVLFVWILPWIFSIATQFQDVDLPLVTRMMMAFSTFLKTNIGTVLIWLGLLAFGISIILSSETWKARIFRVSLSLPGFGVMIRNYYLVKMMRYLKLLQQSGMNYVDSLNLLYDIMEVGPYKEMIQNMLMHVNRGEPMHYWLSNYSYLIPANAAVLMKVGEETAQIAETLQNITDVYEEDLLTSIGSISKIIEPILIVVLWVVIVLIALSVFGIITTILGGVQSG